MSAHSTKARGRHPETRTVIRRAFPVAHVLFEVIDHPENGVTFGLRTLYGPENRPCLFSGHVEPQQARELRALADYLDTLKGKIGGQG
ncbi:hypothetical protein OEW28_18720 [Defluviimonas sp. WL0002]|uniref:Uncharacterized protein n=1 Tax=Albidovulum marisflavi TaxID=2984159 RepID=A0ABT2ZHR5_9RHOB|nr:hypothetical protein [Defluviimonas sp. WL0002]MCV2870651.1 hypothetical protein [Defluviimonas sp. WL0002]